MPYASRPNSGKHANYKKSGDKWTKSTVNALNQGRIERKLLRGVGPTTPEHSPTFQMVPESGDMIGFTT